MKGGDIVSWILINISYNFYILLFYYQYLKVLNHRDTQKEKLLTFYNYTYIPAVNIHILIVDFFIEESAYSHDIVEKLKS